MALLVLLLPMDLQQAAMSLFTLETVLTTLLVTLLSLEALLLVLLPKFLSLVVLLKPPPVETWRWPVAVVRTAETSSFLLQLVALLGVALFPWLVAVA